MSELYSTRAIAVGGRAGTARTDDGLLDVSMALPPGLGGKGGATNPEQLFAAGYAACFANAVLHVARSEQVRIAEKDVETAAVVGIGPNGSGGFQLSVALDVTLGGQTQEVAETLVRKAHEICPYSNAVRGNIDVAISVATR